MSDLKIHKVSFNKENHVKQIVVEYPNGDRAVIAPSVNLGPSEHFKAAMKKLAPLAIKFSPFSLKKQGHVETRHLTIHHDGDDFSVQFSVAGTGGGKGSGGVSLTSKKVHANDLSDQEHELIADVCMYADEFITSTEKRVQLDLFDDASSNGQEPVEALVNA